MDKNLLFKLFCVLCTCYAVLAQFSRPRGVPVAIPKNNPLSRGAGTAKEVSRHLFDENNLSACLVTVFCHANNTKSILDGRTKCTSPLDEKLNTTFREWMNLKKLDLSKYVAPFEVENELFCKLNPEERSEVGKATQIKFFEFVGGDCLRNEPFSRCQLFDKFTACILALMEDMLVKGQCNMEGVTKAIVTIEDTIKVPKAPKLNLG